MDNTNAGRVRLLDGGGYRVLKALPASTGSTNNGNARTQAQNGSSSTSSGGYVNHELLNSLAEHGSRDEAIMFSAVGAGAAGGACVALCPAAGAVLLTTLGGGATEYAAIHPEETEEAAEAIESGVAPLSEGAQKILDWLGPNATKVKSGSDLMLRSQDGTKTIRFDLINFHGDAPHINVQTWMDAIPKWMETSPNEHIYPTGP